MYEEVNVNVIYDERNHQAQPNDIAQSGMRVYQFN